MRRGHSSEPSLRWLLALIPAVLGAIVSALLKRALAEQYVPQLYLRADIVALSWVVGMAITLVVTAILAAQLWNERRGTAQITAVRRQSSDERRRFLRRMDHEMKNPLTAIQAALANLAYANTPETQARSLDSVKTQVQRVSGLVADLRKLTELETRPMESGPVNLTELLEEAMLVAQDRPEASEHPLVLIVPQAPWPLPEIAGDRDLIFLAVHNLLSNALKFTRPGDTIELRAFEDGHTAVIEVADTGPGIPEDEQALVWEELYRARAARGVPGSGLGLALVRAIVERHGGQATLRSRTGQGTVFTLRLPVKQGKTGTAIG